MVVNPDHQQLQHQDKWSFVVFSLQCASRQSGSTFTLRHTRASSYDIRIYTTYIQVFACPFSSTSFPGLGWKRELVEECRRSRRRVKGLVLHTFQHVKVAQSCLAVLGSFDSASESRPGWSGSSAIGQWQSATRHFCQ